MKLYSVILIVGALQWALGGAAIAAGEHDHAEHASEDHGHGHHHESEGPGHAEISEQFAREAGVETEVARSRSIRVVERLYGHIQPNAERRVNVRAPYRGEVVELDVSAGDTVEKNAVLGRIRSLESLETYSLRAPISGTVTHRHLNPGELAENDPVLTLVDLSDVWLELSAYSNQISRLKLDQTIVVQGPDGQGSATAHIDYIAPQRRPQNQSTQVRATLNNEERQWFPGTRVTGEVVVNDREAAVAVKRSALQTLEGQTVVFIRHHNAYEPQTVELGAKDSDYVEVLSGLEAGVEYVTENSFLIKADLLKSGASHSH